MGNNGTGVGTAYTLRPLCLDPHCLCKLALPAPKATVGLGIVWLKGWQGGDREAALKEQVVAAKGLH